MGLDWLVDRRKPLAGFETEYAAILQKMGDIEASSEDASELEKYSVACFEVIGCPRIGIDANATEWFRVVYAENRAARGCAPAFRAYWSRPFKVLLAEHRGKFVAELARSREGHGAVTGILASDVDFRGKMVAYAEWLSPELAEEAYKNHTAQETLYYAAKLENAYQVEAERRERHHEDPMEDDEAVPLAVKWLRFWGGNGFGFYAWH